MCCFLGPHHWLVSGGHPQASGLHTHEAGHAWEFALPRGGLQLITDGAGQLKSSFWVLGQKSSESTDCLKSHLTLLLCLCLLHFLPVSLGSTSLINYLHIKFSSQSPPLGKLTLAQRKNGQSAFGKAARGNHRRRNRAQHCLETWSSTASWSCWFSPCCTSLSHTGSGLVSCVCEFLWASIPFPSLQTAFLNVRQPCPGTLKSDRKASPEARLSSEVHTTHLRCKVHVWVKMRRSRKKTGYEIQIHWHVTVNLLYLKIH